MTVSLKNYAIKTPNTTKAIYIVIANVCVINEEP